MPRQRPPGGQLIDISQGPSTSWSSGRLHALLCVSESSLACMMAGAGGMKWDLLSLHHSLQPSCCQRTQKHSPHKSQLTSALGLTHTCCFALLRPAGPCCCSGLRLCRFRSYSRHWMAIQEHAGRGLHGLYKPLPAQHPHQLCRDQRSTC
jgi:hypothetical protein